MNEVEYNDLYEYIMECQEDVLHYRNTAGAVLQSVIQDLPKNAQMAADIVNSFEGEFDVSIRYKAEDFTFYIFLYFCNFT